METEWIFETIQLNSVITSWKGLNIFVSL